MPDIQLYNATVIVCLELQVSGRTHEEADTVARRAACGRPGIRPTDVHDVVLMPLSLEAKVRADNLRTWQEIQALETGTADQRERWSVGQLPEIELLALARAELFKPFDHLARFSRMTPSDIPHPHLPEVGVTCLKHASVKWSSLENPTLSSVEWEHVTALRVIMADVARHEWLADGPDDAVRIFLREHHGHCGRCGRTASRHSASIQISWAQRTMAREFAL